MVAWWTKNNLGNILFAFYVYKDNSTIHFPTIGNNSLMAFESSPKTFINIRSLNATTNDANLLSLLHESYDRVLFAGDASPSVSISSIYL